MANLLLGLVTGVFFGFFLQKGQALKYDKQLGMLRFQDFTILKVMVSAILVGMVGVHFFVDLGLGKLSLKPTILAANILGGLIFGLGWGMLGYCPGTAVGATGEGRLDAFWGGILGMLVGAGIFAEVYASIKDSILSWGNLGRITLPKLIGINDWVMIIVIWFFMGSVLFLIEKRRR